MHEQLRPVPQALDGAQGRPEEQEHHQERQRHGHGAHVFEGGRPGGQDAEELADQQDQGRESAEQVGEDGEVAEGLRQLPFLRAPDDGPHGQGGDEHDGFVDDGGLDHGYASCDVLGVWLRSGFPQPGFQVTGLTFGEARAAGDGVLEQVQDRARQDLGRAEAGVLLVRDGEIVPVEPARDAGEAELNGGEQGADIAHVPGGAGDQVFQDLVLAAEEQHVLLHQGVDLPALGEG